MEKIHTEDTLGQPSIEESVWTAEEIEAFVISTRFDLFDHGRRHGPEAIRRELEAHEVRPLPSTSTITRILQRECLCGWRWNECLYDPEIRNSQLARGLIEYGPDLILRRKTKP